MDKYTLEKLDLKIYHEKMKNGLDVYIIPKDNVNGIYATLSTKFGSIYNEFVPIGHKKMVKVPFGVAHFLEHKMFEQKDGKDPFTFYSERGCDANANTSKYKTTYLFSGSNSFSECINYLLDYVQSPYFTDENVEKEKGIIEQEIKMYDDDPYFKMYDGIIYNAFIEHPIKYPISGTVKDIYEITKDDLYLCYNTFYHPSNMFLIITGNVDVNDAMDTVRVNQDGKEFDKLKSIKIKQYDEPNKVAKKEEKIKMDIEIPKLGIGYKIDCSKIKMNINDIKQYLSIVFDLKLGNTSLLNDNLKNLNLITHDIDFTFVNTDKHILVIIMVETEEISKVKKMIEEELQNLDITLEQLDRKKKVKKSNCIYRSDSIYSLNNKIMGNIMNYDEIILDDYKKVEQLNMKDLKNITDNINFDNKTVYIINKS